MLNVGYLAKLLIAECGTPQRKNSAKCQTLGKDRHSVKIIYVECQTLTKARLSAKMAVGDDRQSLANILRLALDKEFLFF